MARNKFGGTMDSWIVTTTEVTDDLGAIVDAVRLTDEPVALDIFDAPNGAGVLVSDLQDEAESPISEITIAAGDPYIPPFYGPDAVESLWVQASNGRWLPIPRHVTGSEGGLLTQDAADATYLRADGVRPVVPPRLAMREVVWGGSDPSPWVNLFPGNEDVFEDADTLDTVYGVQSVYIRTKGTGLQTQFGRTDLPAAIDLTNGTPVVIMKVDNPGNLADGKFVLGNAGLTNRYEWDIREAAGTPRYLENGEWVRMTFSMGDAIVFGTPDPSDMVAAYFNLYDDNTGAKVTVHWNLLGVADQSSYANGVLSITFDDGFLSQFTLARPYMDQFGIGATSYMIAETLYNSEDPAFNAYFDLAAAHTLEDFSGWEMASHAYTAATHNAGYPSLSQEAQLDDMRKCRSYLNAQGFRAAEHFAYPLGQRNETVERSVRQTFASGRTLNDIAFESVPVVEPVRLRCWAPDRATVLATYEDKIDAAVASGDWLIVLFHDIVNGGSLSTQTEQTVFEGFIDYAVASGIDIRLVSEVLR